jgi:hypothetical protein
MRDKTTNTWARKPTVQTRGLNRNRQPELKAIFKGAATTIIQQMPNHPLHQDFQRMMFAPRGALHLQGIETRRLGELVELDDEPAGRD